MAGVQCFEDLVAWQKARGLAAEVYRITSQGRFAHDFGLRDQVRRAAVSIMSNIAEGFERYSRAEFKHFLSVARGSAAEVRSQIYLARDLGYVDQPTFERLRNECTEVSRLLGRLRTRLGPKAKAPAS